MNSTWNQFVYKCWSPFYDRFFNSGMFLKARTKVFQNIKLKSGSKILFVGVGTGADIPFFFNRGYDITAIDYSEDMLKVAKEKYSDPSITFLKMDAQKLEFDDANFDYVVASLILSVVPDPEKTIREIVRVLKVNGNFLIFDKFASSKKKMRQRILRPIIKLFGTDIGLNFYDIYKVVENHSGITQDEKIMMNGLYRKIVGVKSADSV